MLHFFKPKHIVPKAIICRYIKIRRHIEELSYIARTLEYIVAKHLHRATPKRRLQVELLSYLLMVAQRDLFLPDALSGYLSKKQVTAFYNTALPLLDQTYIYGIADDREYIHATNTATNITRILLTSSFARILFSLIRISTAKCLTNKKK